MRKGRTFSKLNKAVVNQFEYSTKVYNREREKQAQRLHYKSIFHVFCACAHIVLDRYATYTPCIGIVVLIGKLSTAWFKAFSTVL